MESNPFPHMKIDSPYFLNDIQGRSTCPKCAKSRKYYCYTCYLPLGGEQYEKKVPKVKLPIQIDVIKHPQEVDGKSTAVHAAVIAPDHVTMYTYPAIPQYSDKEKVLLVYPGKEAITFEHFVNSKCPIDNNCYITSDDKSTLSTDIMSTPVCDNVKNKDGDIKQVKICNDITKTDDNTVDTDLLHTKSGITGNMVVHDKITYAGDSVDNNRLYHYKPIPDEDSIETKSNRVYDTEKSIKGSVDSGNIHDEVIVKGDPNHCNIGNKRCGSTIDGGHVQKKIKKQPSVKYRCIFDRVVFIDSTWHTVNKIASDERLQGIQKIELKSQTTKFWRHQVDKPETYLATIEAMYYFLCEYHEKFMPQEYNGEYDNLFFYFVFMYDKIRHMYEGGKYLKAYNQPRKQ